MLLQNLLPFQDTFHHSSAAWGDAAVICPWTMYLTYGDTRLLAEQYGSMKAWVEYIRRQGEHECLWNTGFHFGDWLGLDAKENSLIGATPKDLIATAYYAHSTRLLRDAAVVLGNAADVRQLRGALGKDQEGIPGRVHHTRRTDCRSYANRSRACTYVRLGRWRGEGTGRPRFERAGRPYNAVADNNVITNNRIGPNVTAEHMDIKEGSTGTVVSFNTMNGTGISGANFADSFIDVKGNNASIHDNTANRNGNSIIVDAFQLHQQVSGWGLNADFYNNTVNLDNSTPYIDNAANGTSATAHNNTRNPSGNMV